MFLCSICLDPGWFGELVVFRAISFFDTCGDPRWSIESTSCCLEWCWEGRDLWSNVALDDWECRDLWSTIANPRGAVESALCRDFELELPDVDDGRARSLISCRLRECNLADLVLGDPWHLDDPPWWSWCLRSSFCLRWWSNPLALDGSSDREGLTTTDTLDEIVLPESWGRLDEVASLSFLAEPSFSQVDPSDFLLMDGAWRQSSGVWISMESSIESWELISRMESLLWMSTLHLNDIAGNVHDCRCVDENESTPGISAGLLKKKSDHVTPPSCQTWQVEINGFTRNSK